MWKCFRDTEGQRRITKETEGGHGAGRVSVGAELTGTYCTTVSTTLSVTPFRASDRDMALPLVEETALAGVRPSILPAVPSTAAGAHVTAEMVPWTAFCRVWATLPRRPRGLGWAATWGPGQGQRLL